MVNFEVVFYACLHFTDLKLACICFFTILLYNTMYILYCLALVEEGTLSIKWWTIILFGMCSGKSSNLSKPLTCTRSITSRLPLKGILNMYMNSPVFPPKWFQFVHASLMKHLQCLNILIHQPTLRLPVRTITVKQVFAIIF